MTYTLQMGEAQTRIAHERLVCKSCDGEGFFEQDAYDPYYGHTGEHVSCKECEGTGDRVCDMCTTDLAEHIDIDGGVYCGPCWRKTAEPTPIYYRRTGT